jgi:hypothetical protein
MLKQLLMLRNDTFNFLQHAIDAGHHIAGGEADHAEVVLIQPSGAPCIVKNLRRLCVLVPIDLNDQSDWKAAEIREIWPEWELAAEAMAVNCFAPKITPELLLRFRGLRPKFPRTLC